MIVVSILLAFAIDTWWDDRGRRAEEQVLIVDLEAEFRTNLHALDSIIARHRGFPPRITFLESATADQVRGTPADSTELFQAAMASASTFDAQTGTLDGAITSGKLALLSDTSLRRMVASWRGELDDAREQGAVLMRSSEQVLYRLSRHGGPWIGVPKMTSDDLLGIRGDDELMGFVRVKLLWGFYYQQHLQSMADLTQEILTSLEGH